MFVKRLFIIFLPCILFLTIVLVIVLFYEKQSITIKVKTEAKLDVKRNLWYINKTLPSINTDLIILNQQHEFISFLENKSVNLKHLKIDLLDFTIRKSVYGKIRFIGSTIRGAFVPPSPPDLPIVYSLHPKFTWCHHA